MWQLAVGAEQLQVEVALVELAHRQDGALVDILDAEAAQLLLLVDRVFLEELGQHLFSELAPQLREVVTRGDVMQIGVDTLLSHGSHREHLVVHYVYLKN